jgi:hypothetical protein
VIRSYAEVAFIGDGIEGDWEATKSGGLVPDAYEADDSPAEADSYILYLDVGETEYHTFHDGEDLDWVKFTAEAGRQYMFETTPGDTYADTVLFLYDTDGSTQLTYNDDRTLYAGITYSFADVGTYYLMVRAYGDDSPGSDYYLTVSDNGSTEPPAGEAFLIGEWTLTYNWRGTTTISFATNHTFSTGSENQGTWALSGTTIVWVYENGTTYTGTVQSETYMNGTMVSIDSSEGDWEATK